jgi:hypothetical protein
VHEVPPNHERCRDLVSEMSQLRIDYFLLGDGLSIKFDNAIRKGKEFYYIVRASLIN